MDLVLSDDYDKHDFVAAVRKQLEQRYPMLRKTPVLAISALNGTGVNELMPIVFEARDRWAKVIGTGLLNRWLADVTKSKAPPLNENGRKINIKYIIQTKGRPPTFLLFCNVRVLPTSYVRYLIRSFQDAFKMYGMDVRMAVKESSHENPYTRNKNKKLGIGGTRLGIGGSRNRKKRFIEVLKSTGSRPRKGISRRHSYKKQ
jgi:GTP-binding protein